MMNDLISKLNLVQQEAVSVLDGPVMIVAGAGSGKTRVLTFRIANLIAHNVPPHQILSLTFTNKAAAEMKKRIEELTGPAVRAIWAGTFHSIFARLLRFESELIGYHRNFSIFDTDDSRSVVKKILAAHKIPTQDVTPRSLHHFISKAKNRLQAPHFFEQTASDRLDKIRAMVYGEYEEYLLRNNAMDFDDLLVKPILLFRKHHDVLERYQQRFRYILVDEYQDTNRAQYELLLLLAAGHKNICVVGDDAQSIYAFRGADIRNILEFEKDYPECRTFRLEQNYRSTKKILEAADGVIKRNKRQIQKKLWTSNEEGAKISVLQASDDKEEGSIILRHLQEECAVRKLDLKDFAILYRTNAQSRAIEESLIRSKTPYMIVGGIEFYKRKEVKDIVAYLRAIVNPADEESLLRVINVPSRGIGDVTIDKLKNSIILLPEGDRTFFLAMKHCDTIDGLGAKTKSAVKNFALMIEKYRNLKMTFSPSEIGASLLDELGILGDYKDENTPESLARVDNIKELLGSLKEFCDETPDGTLEQFLEQISLITSVDLKMDGRNVVTLMTFHAAKGLEFPVVFMTGMEEGLFPLDQGERTELELEEERRLCYVGMTRAMKKLYMTWASKRYRSGNAWFSTMSRFISEIENSLIESVAVTPEFIRPSQPANESRKRHAPVRGKTAGQAARERSHPAYEDESQETSALKEGMMIEHEMFGRGRILQLSGKGEGQKAIVAFDRVGSKHLMLKYAPIRIL